MTTPVQEKLYQAEHTASVAGRNWAVFNPDDKPVEDLPIIYGFNNGGNPGWYFAALLAEDGTGLGSHICSAECYMEHDLGILEGTRSDRHETFRAHYPQGYRMEFVRENEVKQHAGLMAAYEKNQALAEEAAAEKE